MDYMHSLKLHVLRVVREGGWFMGTFICSFLFRKFDSSFTES